MTHSLAINSTITKETAATKARAGSSKSELIQSKSQVLSMFGNGSSNRVAIRKNAVKKIELLFSLATKVMKSTPFYDGYNGINYDLTVSTLAEAQEFMNDEYDNLKIDLNRNVHNDDIELVITKGGWAAVEFFLTFGEVEPAIIETLTVEDEQEHVKPRMTYQAVAAYLDSGFISPLNHGLVATDEVQEDEEKKIVKVKVFWSESDIFNSELCKEGEDEINKVISIEEYNRLAWLTLAEQKQYIAKTGEGFGYDKTKVEITLATGKVIQFRHDICLREPTLEGEWAQWVDYCRAEDERKTAKLH
ncbi:LPD25 domain-containing protein [Aliivibrio wodanis]|uniref:LPD25 domain-containing protein n=1 Tax=Aliivibrio wodanis TaxID=80852 RepID=UPI00406C8BBC